MFHVPEKYRNRTHPYLGSDSTYGNNGLFCIPIKKSIALVIASDGEGWQHVSVHMVLKGKECIPTWDEMNYIKDIFWDAEDCVIQYHPPKSRYVNNHKFTLHLWKPTNAVIPMPPIDLIGKI